MGLSSEPTHIRLRGVRQNNLKNFDLDLPLNRLIVIAGLSGSGKSSLAFDTLFAEGQRRYIETFSPYARQFFDRMDKPQVDAILGIPPAIAIEQRNTVKTTRSTVGTMTEITDYMKVLWPHLATLHCRGCGQPVTQESPQRVWDSLCQAAPGTEVLVTFELPLTEKLSLAESLSLIARQGYQRLLVGEQVVRVDDAARELPASGRAVTVLQDRLKLSPGNRSRFTEACEQAYHFGKGKLSVKTIGPAQAAVRTWRFSNRLHCASCDIEYRAPSPAMFSFNHPSGACPACRGFGRVIGIDYGLALPDPSRTLAEGVVKPWQTGQGRECHTDLLRVCREQGIPTDVPFRDLPEHWQRLVVEGDPDYGKDPAHEWPRAWYGVKGYFRWLESRAYKMHVRVLLSRYRAYTRCPACLGARFQPDTLLHRLHWNPAPGHSPSLPPTLSLPEFYQLPVRDAHTVVKTLARQARSASHQTLRLALGEIEARLGYLQEAGLGYLTLDRATRTLSGGETERVNLTTCLGASLVNTLFILDEPSVGLHARDTNRLVRILKRLRDAGNTVVVVEHEPSVIRAADQIVDLGPGHGSTGGEIVFQGTYGQLLRHRRSLTGAYLSGRKRVGAERRRPVAGREVSWLTLANATRHNLKHVAVRMPLRRLVAITGVSGSGKSTLIREELWPALRAQLGPGGFPATEPAADANEAEAGEDEASAAGAARVSGWESLSQVVLVDQSGLGKTPRSNPAVYIGAFEPIRDCFAQTEMARRKGLKSSAFSFNSGQGQCERCRGAGYEKIEMQFLSDVFIRCPDCAGRRYRPHILEVKLQAATAPGQTPPPAWSIGDLLDATVEQAIEFLSGFPELRPAGRALAALELLQRVGLGYLKLGQPINTLSGGESQRLKLVRHLAESARPAAKQTDDADPQSILFLFDEPTTGLHFDDVRVLVEVFQGLVDAGHSVVVIEHNLDVIRCSDWVIDLGPEAGDEGGRIVVEGPPDQVAACTSSHTGQALRG